MEQSWDIHFNTYHFYRVGHPLVRAIRLGNSNLSLWAYEVADGSERGVVLGEVMCDLSTRLLKNRDVPDIDRSYLL